MLLLESVTTILIPVPAGNATPLDLEFNPFNNKVYVSNFGSGVVSVIR